MDGFAMKRALETALADLAECERRIRALCEEYRKTVNIRWLCLYSKGGEAGTPVYGPFWARLRRAKVKGETRVIKEHLGRRLTRGMMYRLGVLDHAAALEDLDRRAKLLRDRKTRVAASLDKVRKLLARFAE